MLPTTTYYDLLPHTTYYVDRQAGAAALSSTQADVRAAGEAVDTELLTAQPVLLRKHLVVLYVHYLLLKQTHARQARLSTTARVE